MAQPVWVLSVDLQTKTATFQSGLADAARSARSAFTDIKGGAGEAGRETGYSMMEARHSVMLLGEEFGIHLPRAVSGFIASIGPLGGLLEAAFPFLAIIAGATILIEHLQKLHEAGEKLSGDQLSFLTASNVAFNSLNEKILQAEIRSDELKNDHLGALKHQLELIDAQSMSDLVKTFEDLEKSADAVMKDLEGHWYTFGKGSEGAQHSIEDFKRQYANLQSNDDGGKAASEALHEKVKREASILKALKESTFAPTNNQAADAESYNKAIAAHKTLDDLGVKRGATLTKQIEAQQVQVDLLNKMVRAEEQRAKLTGIEEDNAKKSASNSASAEASTAARAHASSQQKIAQEGLTAEKAAADAALTVRRGSLEERLQIDLAYAKKERDLQLSGNAAETAALDKSGKDYQNQLKAAKDKNLEIEAEYQAKVSELNAASSVAIAARNLQAIETEEREKIAATQQGSAARLAAIDSALKRAQELSLQDTDFYRNLQVQREQAARQEAEQESRLAEEMGVKQAEADAKQGELVLAAYRQSIALRRSLQNVSAQQQLSDSIRLADLEFQIKQAEYAKELAALDKFSKDYLAKKKALENAEKQSQQEHEQEITSLRQKAEEERNQRILSAENQFRSAIAGGLSQVIMGHESFAKMMSQIGDQVVGDIIKNTILILFQQDKQRLGDAKTAAANAYSSVSAIPVVGPFLAPAAAAAAFTAVLAFQSGTDKVPGVGRGDTVPAMLEPGEGVVPGGVMDGLSKMARSGGFDRQPSHNVVMHVTHNVSVMDGDGLQPLLEKNSSQLEQHFQKVVRKMNR